MVSWNGLDFFHAAIISFIIESHLKIELLFSCINSLNSAHVSGKQIKNEAIKNAGIEEAKAEQIEWKFKDLAFDLFHPFEESRSLGSEAKSSAK